MWIICGVVGLILFLLGLAVIGYVILVYNRFINLKNGIENSFRQIQVGMKKRADMIAQLVDAARGYIKFEKDVMTGVTKLRSAPLGKPGDVRKADALATSLLGRIFAVMENYPNLRGVEAVTSLQNSIKDVEGEIARLRYLYNDQVQSFNMMVERFPSNIIASIFGFKRREYLRFEKGIEERPKVRVY